MGRTRLCGLFLQNHTLACGGLQEKDANQPFHGGNRGSNPLGDANLTIMVGGVVATPDDERDFQAEGGGERSQKTLAA